VAKKKTPLERKITISQGEIETQILLTPILKLRSHIAGNVAMARNIPLNEE